MGAAEYRQLERRAGIRIWRALHRAEHVLGVDGSNGFVREGERGLQVLENLVFRLGGSCRLTLGSRRGVIGDDGSI